MAKQVKKETEGRFTVVKAFRDINDWDKEFEVGDDVSDFEQSRLDSLIERGLISDSLATEADELSK